MAEGRQQASAFHATAIVGTAAASTSQAETAAAVGGEPREPEKRKRGRPKKPKPKAEQLGEPRPKRPRGRPKGSKNKLPSKVKAQLLRESVQSRKGRLSKSECLIKPDISGVSQTVSVSFWTRKNPEGGPQTSGPR